MLASSCRKLVVWVRHFGVCFLGLAIALGQCRWGFGGVLAGLKNSLVLTVEQSKGLEFDDARRILRAHSLGVAHVVVTWCGTRCCHLVGLAG